MANQMDLMEMKRKIAEDILKTMDEDEIYEMIPLAAIPHQNEKRCICIKCTFDRWINLQEGE